MFVVCGRLASSLRPSPNDPQRISHLWLLRLAFLRAPGAMTRPHGERVTPQIGGFGVTTWIIPGTSLTILWPGPNSHLFVGRGTTFVPIANHRASGVYDTFDLARAAVAEFLRDGRE